MIGQMSQREKTLAFLVGGVLFLLLNVVLIKFFMANHAEQQRVLALTQGKINGLKQQESQRALWSQRDAYLTQNMPKMGDPQVENRKLSEAVKEIARKHTITIETPNPGVANRQKEYVSLGVKVSAKAPWTQMFDFLRELQMPGQFLVLDPVELKVDANDKTQLRAEVTVTRWFLP
jgi:hypothetical protein